jgi:hypothetical protein
MTIRLIIGIVSLCTAIASFTIAGKLVDRMFDDNRRSDDRRWNYSDLGHWARKDFFIVSEYRRLNPQGKLYARWRVALILGIVASAAVAVCLLTQIR